MPRIRTIKPEFWSSPDTARASAVARLAYIGMWNWADDYGRGTLNLKELEGFIFPNDDVSQLSVGTSDASEGSSETFRRVVKEVVDVFGLVVYEVDRRTYYEIPSWTSHQRTERKAKSKYPGPEDAETPPDQGSEGTSYIFRHTAQEVPAHSAGSSRKKEHRNRGTGEGISASSATSEPDGPSVPDVNDPPLESLDALADDWRRHPKAPGVYGTPDDPRCEEHADLPPNEAPKCPKCARARKWFESNAQDDTTEAAQARRQAIDACDECDEQGWLLTNAGAVRCNHTPQPTTATGPF